MQSKGHGVVLLGMVMHAHVLVSVIVRGVTAGLPTGRFWKQCQSGGMPPTLLHKQWPTVSDSLSRASQGSQRSRESWHCHFWTVQCAGCVPQVWHPRLLCRLIMHETQKSQAEVVQFATSATIAYSGRVGAMQSTDAFLVVEPMG